jgi:MFS family permease
VIVFLVPFGYLFAENITHIIFIQAIFGFGAGLVYPGWMTLFTRFINDGKEGFDWSLDSAALSLGNGIAIALSGFIAEAFGFNTLFYLVITLNFISLVMILCLLKFKDDILSNRNVIKYIIRKFF